MIPAIRSRVAIPSLVLVVSSLLLAGGSARGDNVELDPPSTPEGYVALLLINETAFPGEKRYTSEEESKNCMLSVLWVLHCRALVIPPGYRQRHVAAVETTSVIDVMTAGGVRGQVDGFYEDANGRPVATPRVHERVNYLLIIANQGEPGRMARMLLYAQNLSRQYFKTGPARQRSLC